MFVVITLDDYSIIPTAKDVIIKVILFGITLVGRVMIGIFFYIIWLIKFSTGAERLWSNKLMFKLPTMQVLTRGSREETIGSSAIENFSVLIYTLRL